MTLGLALARRAEDAAPSIEDKVVEFSPWSYVSSSTWRCSLLLLLSPAHDCCSVPRLSSRDTSISFLLSIASFSLLLSLSSLGGSTEILDYSVKLFYISLLLSLILVESFVASSAVFSLGLFVTISYSFLSS